ncbi:MAG: AAA family ATPase, partial [Acidimicrobiales bacterium]|nr:AAA family ATPase [Acidimicrobiales bacterium]
MAAARCPLLLEREYELAVLASSLGSLFAGSGGALTLMGGTGLGKTRIASELARAASARGAVVLWVGVEPDGVCGEPFGALARLVRSAIAAGASETGGTAALFGRARTALGLDHGPAAAMPPAVDMCPEPVAARGLVAELVEQLCERQPVVVIFDDFHHAAPETVSSGQLLARDSAELPLLVVVTSASTDGSELGVGLRVELSPLTEPAVRQMITSCWHDEVPDELVTALIEHAKGVPLFVEELLAAALDDHEGRVPVSFASSVGRRLRNREVTRRVLEVAALLGTTFEWWLVAEIVSSPAHEVLNALQDGIDLGVLGPDDGSDARLFRFRSEATRDAVLSELAPARRCDHATAALAVLEQRYPGLPGARLFQAAVLAEQAGRRDRAGALWSEAGSRCLALGAFQEAGRCFARAGEVAGAGRPEGTAWGVVSVVDPLEVALGRARAYAGAGAEADVERALAELRQAVQAEAIADLERARQRAAAAHTAIGFGLLWGGRVMH